jgi:hypothetical protein
MKKGIFLVGIVLAVAGGALFFGYLALPDFLSFLSISILGFPLTLIITILGILLALYGWKKQY